MLPSTRKASPPNIRFSVTPSSRWIATRIRSDRSSSYAMPTSVSLGTDNNGLVPSDRPPRPAMNSAPNLRDLGGWPTADGGRIRSGVVFRSAGLDRLADEDLPAFGELGISTVFDLRTQHETTDQPDRLPAGIASVQLDVLADADRAAPAELQRIFSNPALAGEQLGDGQAERYFESAYRGFVTLPSARGAYRRLFEAIAEADEPVLFHCATGKDRTGWATAVLFSLLGVTDSVVMEEYLLTNTDLLPAVQPWIDQFAARGRGPRAPDADPGRAAQLSRGGARGDARDLRHRRGVRRDGARALPRHPRSAARAPGRKGCSGHIRHRGLVRRLAFPSRSPAAPNRL